MKLLVYLVILCVCDVFSVTMAMGLDYYGKSRDYHKVVRKRINIILVVSRYEKDNFMPTEDRPISRKSFIFQWINIAYVVIYIIIAIVETFIYTSDIIMYTTLIISGIYGVINLVASLWLGAMPENS